MCRVWGLWFWGLGFRVGACCLGRVQGLRRDWGRASRHMIFMYIRTHNPSYRGPQKGTLNPKPRKSHVARIVNVLGFGSSDDGAGIGSTLPNTNI